MRPRLRDGDMSNSRSSSSGSLSSASKGGNGSYVTESGKPIVQIAFYGPDGADNGTCVWMNSLAACWTGDGTNNFAHCEIRFSNNKACSVTEETEDKETGEKYGGFVHYVERSLSREGYEFVEFAVTQKQEAKMRKLAKSCARKRVPFNKAAMLLNFLAPFKWSPIDREGRAYFCSELIIVILQEAGLMMNLKPCTTSPTGLWHALSELESVCHSYNQGHISVNSDMLVAPKPSSSRLTMVDGPKQKKKKKRVGSGGFILAPLKKKE